MAAIMGKSGSARIGANKILNIDSWTLNPTIEVADITQYGSSFRARMQTIKDWTAEVSGTLDSTDAQQGTLLDQGTTSSGNIALRLYINDANYWSGNAVVTGFAVASSVGDKITVSYSLSGNGALSYT